MPCGATALTAQVETGRKKRSLVTGTYAQHPYRYTRPSDHISNVISKGKIEYSCMSPAPA